MYTSGRRCVLQIGLVRKVHKEIEKILYVANVMDVASLIEREIVLSDSSEQVYNNYNFKS